MAISGWFNQRIFRFSLVLLGVFSLFYNIHVLLLYHQNVLYRIKI